MAAPLGTRGEDMSASTVSSQLLYSDNYAECYQESKLTVVKESRSSVNSQFPTVDVSQNSVLSRIRQFLPELSMANKEMSLELVSNPDSADKFNIEHLEEFSGEHIEMNLSVVPPELLAEGDSSTDESYSESESECDSEVPERDNDACPTEVKQVLKLQLTPKCVRAGIEVLEHIQPPGQDVTNT